MKGIPFTLWLIIVSVAIPLSLFNSIVYGEETRPEEPQNTAADQAKPDVFKPQTVCPLTGGDINKEAYADYKGQRIYFCCMGCEPRFYKNPGKSLQRIKENGEMAESLDPLSVQPQCPVSGEAIDPSVYVDHNGKRIYFCCEKCRKKFNKKPEKFLQKMENSKKSS